MKFFNWIGGMFNPARKFGELFRENAEAKGQRSHLERMAATELNTAVLGQFAAEFHARDNRTWWDSLVDGLNRLPRPLMTFAIVGFFFVAPFYPDTLLKVSKAYGELPNGYWALLSVVVGFYFGGRMQVKGQDMVVKAAAIERIKEAVSADAATKAVLADDEPQIESTFRAAAKKEAKERRANKTARDWRERRGRSAR